MWLRGIWFVSSLLFSSLCFLFAVSFFLDLPSFSLFLSFCSFFFFFPCFFFAFRNLPQINPSLFFLFRMQSSSAVSSLRTVAPQLKAFLDRALTLSSRPSLDLVPYQHLAWILEARNSESSKNSKNVEIREEGWMGVELGSLVYAMWLSFHTRSWHNTFNPAGKIARMDSVGESRVSYFYFLCVHCFSRKHNLRPLISM